jgi:tetratricopeptide (TPR) repeat protein
MISVPALARGLLERAVVMAICLFALLTVAGSAWGETDTDLLKKARAQFQQATEMEQAGNYSAALQLFREVGQFKMTPQIRFHIALCEEKLGKLVAALGGYELALADAEAVGPAFKQEVETTVGALRARIPKIVIQRGEGAQAAEIDLDGVTLGNSSIGVESPIDPGPHTVTGKARGYKDFETTITVAEQETKEVKVVLEALPVEEREALDRGQERPVQPEPLKKPGWHWIGGGVGVGVGAVAWIIAGAFYLQRESNLRSVESFCGGKGECAFSNPDGGPEALKKYNDAKTYNSIAIGSLITGAVFVGAGVVLFLLPPKKSEPKKPKSAELHLEPSAPGSQAGLSLVGRF